MTKSTTTILTIPNRKITSGEYGAAHGHNVSHMEILEDVLHLPKSTTSYTVYTGNVIELNIEGKITARVQKEIDRFVEQGFILEVEVL